MTASEAGAAPAPKKIIIFSLLLLAGCPDTVGQQCPPKTAAVAQLALSFTGQASSSECVQTLSDGGVSLFTADGGFMLPSTIWCFGPGSDGGPQLYLAVPGKSLRSSDLLPDGGFHFADQIAPTSGICGSCLISIAETFDGTLLAGAADAGFTLKTDGGLPAIAGLSGLITDQLATTGGGACVTGPDAGCNTPCAVTYSVTGTPF